MSRRRAAAGSRAAAGASAWQVIARTKAARPADSEEIRMKMPSHSIVAAALALALLPTSALEAQTAHSHQHRFDDASKWARVFDDPQRDAWQKPHEVIQTLAPKPDAVIADIGAGTGYFAMRFAHMVPQGRVYAADTEPAMVKHLAERSEHAGLLNVVALQAAADSPRLPEKVDLAVFVDV
jgi:predicted methyltransferase